MDITSSPILKPEIGRLAAAEPSFRELVSRVLRESGKDRKLVAMELSDRTGERITPGMLNDWLAPSKGKVRFPASFIRALCEITGDYRAARAVLPDELAAILKIGEDAAQSRELLREASVAIEKLGKVMPQTKLQRRSNR